MSNVICYGALIPDRVLRLPRFPQPGEGLHALDDTLYLGGEPCNVGAHLSQWGVEVALAGNNLGSDQLGDFVRAQLAERPHTIHFARTDPAIRTPTCYIWTTPDGERTIVPSWPPTISWTLPDLRTIQQARLVSVSIYGPGMDQMIHLARQHARPLAIADISGPDDPRLPGAVIVTTSRAVLQRRHGVDHVRPWMQAVQAMGGALVVVSDGARPALALTPEGQWIEALPPAITPVDTTGAGDALKAGMIFGWLHHWPIQRALAFAVAAASLQCLHHGAAEFISAQAEIERLMQHVDLI